MIDVLHVLLGGSLSYIHRFSITPPHPPPKSHEQNRTSSSPDERFLTIGPPWGQGFNYMLLGIVLYEALAVYSTYYPSVHVSGVSSMFLPISSGQWPARLGMTSYSLLGWAICFSGYVLRYTAIRVMGNHFTHQLALRDQHKLVTYGPYSIVRYPSYAGFYAYAVGSSIFFLGPGSVLFESGFLHTWIGILFACHWFAYLAYLCTNFMRRTGEEDAFLRANFPEEWQKWSEKVWYCLLPGLY